MLLQMRFKYCICLILLFSVPSLKAQKIVSNEDFEKVYSPDILSGADSLLVFNRKSIDLGIISEDDSPAEHTFCCYNKSQSRIVVTKLSSSCGCTKVEIDNPILEPGDKTEIKVTYNPFGRPGTILTNVLVYTDISQKYPIATLKLTGKVTPSAALWKSYRYTIGELKLRRKEIDFGYVKRGQKRLERIACANAGSAPLKVTADKIVLPEFVSVYTEPEILQSSEEGSLIIAIDGEKLPEGKRGTGKIKILLNGLSASPIERMLTIHLRYENLTE